MSDTNNRFYWLKMRRDFFKRHDIRILESLPNGKEYSLFYIKLMLESIDHNGELRYSEKQPYTINMLCSITDMAKDVVETALATLEELELVEIAEDGTYIIPHVAEMIDSVVDSDDANRQRRSRENRKQRAVPCDKDVTMCHKDVTDVSQHCHENCDTNVTNRNESKIKNKSKNNIPPIVPRGTDGDTRFDTFWSAYPRHEGKNKARASFDKLRPDDELLNTIINAIALQKQSDQWKRDGGQYIPHPSTWLNQKRWEDEIPSTETTPQRNFLN